MHTCKITDQDIECAIVTQIDMQNNMFEFFESQQASKIT